MLSMIDSWSLTPSPCQARACSRLMTSKRQISQRAALHGSSISMHAGPTFDSSHQVCSLLPGNGYLITLSDKLGKVRTLIKVRYGAQTQFHCQSCWVTSLQDLWGMDMSTKSHTLLGVSIRIFCNHAHPCADMRMQRDCFCLTSLMKLHLLAN